MEHLMLRGKATDHIWAMADGDEPAVIGVRLDSGDGGTVYVTREQALLLAKDLIDMVYQLNTSEPGTLYGQK